MTREEFWALVAQTARDAQALPDRRRGLLRRLVLERPGRKHVRALETSLARLPDDEVLSWQTHLDALRSDAHRRDLWDAASLLHGALFEDTFTDLRTWLVSQGAAAYARVLADLDALVDVAPPDLAERLHDAEAWGYVALEVWDTRREDAMPRPAFGGDGEPGGQPLDAEELRRRYPRLAERYG